MIGEFMSIGKPFSIQRFSEAMSEGSPNPFLSVSIGDSGKSPLATRPKGTVLQESP
jgi:hypothetical protein